MMSMRAAAGFGHNHALGKRLQRATETEAQKVMNHK
jgi:hypothetical protein